MKRLSLLILILTLCVSLTVRVGALSAPYVNDYAAVLSDSAAGLIKDTSIYTKHALDVDVIVLTVEGLSGYPFEDFARYTLAGVPDISDMHVMLLYSARDNDAYIYTNLVYLDGANLVREYMRGHLDNGNRGRAVLEGYKAVVRELFDFMGVVPSEAIERNLTPGNAGSGADLWYFAAALGSFLLMVRMVMVNRKYSKYHSDKNNITPRKHKRHYEGDKEYDYENERKSDD